MNRSLVDEPLLQVTYHNATRDPVSLGHGVSFHERDPGGGLVAATLGVDRRLGTDPASSGEAVWPVGSPDSVFTSTSVIEAGNQYVATVSVQELPDGEYLTAHVGTFFQPDSPWVAGLALIRLGPCSGAGEPIS